MSEEKHYLDEQWDDFPLPDGEESWQKMQHLLERAKKRRRVIPFWLWRYAGLGLLLISMGVVGWLIIENDKAETKTSSSVQENSLETKERKSHTATGSPEKTSTLQTDRVVAKIGQPNSIAIPEKLIIEKAKRQKTKTTASLTKSGIKNNKEIVQRIDNSKPEKFNETTSENIPQEAELTDAENKYLRKDASTIIAAPKKDSITISDTTATKVAEPVAGYEQKKAQKKDYSGLVFSAGIGLQQAIAFDGQQSSAYNYKGKRSAVSDRIPSLYIRLQKESWFAQVEFQYAVPQPVKQFVFSQQTKYSIASQNLNTEQFSLQKLYYHQLPFTVNYFILPNWSVGTGAMYSILAGAVTEQEIKSKNFQTGTESISRNITPIQGYKDSFLYKTTTGIVLQTDYHWKRFSLGLRFTKHLQPFIQYTVPNGDILNEKNKMLQALLRFRLFEK